MLIGYRLQIFCASDGRLGRFKERHDTILRNWGESSNRDENICSA